MLLPFSIFGVVEIIHCDFGVLCVAICMEFFLVFRVFAFGVRVLMFGVRFSDSGVRVLAFGVRFSGFGVRILAFGVRFSGSGVRVLTFGVRFTLKNVFLKLIMADVSFFLYA